MSESSVPETTVTLDDFEPPMFTPEWDAWKAAMDEQFRARVGDEGFARAQERTRAILAEET